MSNLINQECVIKFVIKFVGTRVGMDMIELGIYGNRSQNVENSQFYRDRLYIICETT